MQEMRSPEFKEKMKQGPVALLTVMPNGPISMGRPLAQWFVFLIVVGIFVALHRQPDLARRHALHARVPDRGRDRIHRLFAGVVRAIDLVPAILGPDAQGVLRRPDLRPAHGGDVRVAVAALDARGAIQVSPGVPAEWSASHASQCYDRGWVMT